MEHGPPLAVVNLSEPLPGVRFRSTPSHVVPAAGRTKSPDASAAAAAADVPAPAAADAPK